MPRLPYALTFSSNSLPLGEIIQRITQERGSFADLTEESLLHEIEEEAQKGTEEDSDLLYGAHAEPQLDEGEGEGADKQVADDDDDDDNESKREDRIIDDDAFDKVRQELVGLISTAQNESALSQDFISLLMSCLRPAAGTTSMSPHLKQHIPVGSLSADTAKPTAVEDDPLVSAGWKIEALKHGSATLKNAAQRLEGEADKEELYWESVLSIVSSGEVLYKIRKGDARGLGIKYGYGDAGSEYQDRGVAALRRRANGTMSFQTGIAKRTKVLRVNLYTMVNGERTFQGSSAGIKIIEDEKSVEDEIKNARNFLFEEELFYEMAKEARSLISHRVKIQNGKIVIKLYDEILEIEFIDYCYKRPKNEEGMEDEEDHDMDGEEDEEAGRTKSHRSDQVKVSKRASLICLAFHILLCYAHRKSLETKASIPGPFNTKEKKARTSLYVIRPLIAHILHEKIMTRTKKAVELIAQNVPNLEIRTEPMALESKAPSGSGSSGTVGSTSGSTSGYLGRLAMHPMSKLSVSLKDEITVLVVTGSPLQSYTPLYEAYAYAWNDKDRQKPISQASFYDLSELEEWVRWILDEKRSHMASVI